MQFMKRNGPAYVTMIKRTQVKNYSTSHWKTVMMNAAKMKIALHLQVVPVMYAGLQIKVKPCINGKNQLIFMPLAMKR